MIKLSEHYAAALDKKTHHRDAIKLSLLSQIVGEISLTIAFGIADKQKESLLQSTNGLLKWMGLASLREGAKTLDGAKQAALRLASFDLPASIRTLCWLLSGLARKQEEHGSFSIVRQVLYDTLPPELTKGDAEFLVDSLLGHMRELGWSEPWLFTEVIAPLLEESRVTPDNLSGIWLKELLSCHNRLLAGETVSFNRLREGRVTEVAAFLFATSSFEAQDKTIGALQKALKKARANVQQPLASTMNWNKWDCSLEVAMWIYAFCRHVEHYMKELSILPTQFVDLRKLSKDVAMARTLEEWRHNGVEQGALAAFIDEVGEILSDG